MSSVVKWRSTTPGKTPMQLPASYKSSSTPGKTPMQLPASYKSSSTLVRSSTPGRSAVVSSFQPRSSKSSSYTPKTKDNLRRRQAKVQRRQLQADAKAHKIQMRHQQHELRHQKRMDALDYDAKHKEVVGISPIAKYGLIGGGVVVLLLMFVK